MIDLERIPHDNPIGINISGPSCQCERTLHLNANLAEIICVIDRSGSMNSIRSDAIGGFNRFLEEQQNHPGDARLSLVFFNHEYVVIHEGVSIQQVPPLSDVTFVPEGMTALLDAVGRTIGDVGKRLAEMPEQDRPFKVIFVILTDGEENSSRVYTLEQIRGMIEHQRAVYSWEFVFLAANQDAFAAAERLSIPRDNTDGFSATKSGTATAFCTMSSMVKLHRKPRG